MGASINHDLKKKQYFKMNNNVLKQSPLLKFATKLRTPFLPNKTIAITTTSSLDSIVLKPGPVG
jgi:hypothetical protein